jgi:hypothetical protein
VQQPLAAVYKLAVVVEAAAQQLQAALNRLAAQERVAAEGRRAAHMPEVEVVAEEQRPQAAEVVEEQPLALPELPQPMAGRTSDRIASLQHSMIRSRRKT